jgi:hypothetical protein
MTSMTRQYSAAASRASEAVEKAADSWTEGVRRMTGLFPAMPQVDLVPAVERYFDLVQRAVDMNRNITVRWAQAAGTLTGTVRQQAESTGQAVRERAESAGEAVRERAESFDQAAAEQAQKAEQAEKEMARKAERAAAEQAQKAEQAEKERAQEARRLEREHARQAHQRARERYEGLTKAELSDLLAKRGLPKSGNVNELVDRLAEADEK